MIVCWLDARFIDTGPPFPAGSVPTIGWKHPPQIGVPASVSLRSISSPIQGAELGQSLSSSRLLNQHERRSPGVKVWRPERPVAPLDISVLQYL